MHWSQTESSERSLEWLQYCMMIVSGSGAAAALRFTELLYLVLEEGVKPRGHHLQLGEPSPTVT